ncbi:MAG: flagellar biosynthetic protein FliQ [Chlamydiales bacterium]|jgi:flagellar biosynthetic protein FliQ|nr:flagellar biosynthetic protein FliQ [Chlamydiales bacterium]
MTPEIMIDIINQALFVALEISAPLLIMALVVGLFISILQSVTQINEMTLTFVPKMFLFTVLLMALFPWISKVLVNYAHEVLIDHWDKLKDIRNYTS